MHRNNLLIIPIKRLPAWLYLLEEELLLGLEDIAKAPRIEEIPQVHKVKRLFYFQKILYLEFFNLAADKRPFFYLILWPTYIL